VRHKHGLARGGILIGWAIAWNDSAAAGTALHSCSHATQVVDRAEWFVRRPAALVIEPGEKPAHLVGIFPAVFPAGIARPVLTENLFEREISRRGQIPY
jgi:hypothetical protein